MNLYTEYFRDLLNDKAEEFQWEGVVDGQLYRPDFSDLDEDAQERKFDDYHLASEDAVWNEQQEILARVMADRMRAPMTEEERANITHLWSRFCKAA